jgi:hypothetical protein
MGRSIGRHGGRFSAPSAAWGPRLAAIAAAVVLVLLGAGEALACPQCALGRDEGTGPDLLVAGMMAAPFVVVFVVIRAIASLGRRGRDRPPAERDEEADRS